MSHTIRDKKKLLTRINRIKGQTEALEKALDKNSECLLVLQQIAAIRGALNGLMNQVLEGYIREHLGDENISTNQRHINSEQLINILQSYLK